MQNYLINYTQRKDARNEKRIIYTIKAGCD